MSDRRLNGNHRWTWILLLTLCLGLGGCGDDGGGITSPANENAGTAAIALKMSAATAAELSRIEVVVSGAAMDEIRETLEWDGETATGTVTVPAGGGRLFTLNAYDLDGNLRYTGEDRTDVVAGAEVTVEITMRRASSSSGSADVPTGDIPGLATIEIRNIESSNWDGDIEDDGLEVSLSFKDAADELIRWEGAVVSASLKLFVAQGAYTEAKKYTAPVFEGSSIIHSSEEDRLIRAPYEETLPNISAEDITENSYSPGNYYFNGVIEVTVTLANGDSFAARQGTPIRVSTEVLQILGII
jgi:hypothetical protein